MLAFATLISVVLMASPALKGIYRTIRLSDGSSLKVQLCGDEHLGYWTSEDGRMFINRNEKGEMKEVSETEMSEMRNAKCVMRNS